jgi:elongation factor Ts
VLLVEAEGDFDKAIQNLRKRTKVAANRSDRESSEGAAVSFINADKTKGVHHFKLRNRFRR